MVNSHPGGEGDGYSGQIVRPTGRERRAFSWCWRQSPGPVVALARALRGQHPVATAPDTARNGRGRAPKRQKNMKTEARTCPHLPAEADICPDCHFVSGNLIFAR